MDADRERRHVMFVDDEPATQQLVERSLRGEALRLTCVTDGAQALQVLERARVDLLVICAHDDAGRRRRRAAAPPRQPRADDPRDRGRPTASRPRRCRGRALRLHARAGSSR
jgi:CheY-like chemotaxis protein